MPYPSYPPNVNTRLAVAADAGALARIGESLGYGILEEATRVNNLQTILASCGDRLWVLEKDGELAAYLHAVQVTRLASAPFIEIAGLAVSPPERRRGLATRLLQHAEHWAVEQGMKLRVRCRDDREAGNQFYQALGFTRAKRQNVYEKNPPAGKKHAPAGGRD